MNTPTSASYSPLTDAGLNRRRKPSTKLTIQQATSFRPISVTSSFIRICEKIIATRIKDIIEPLLMNSQFGFRENRSTIDAIYKLLFYSREELHSTPDDFPVVFLDIEKAYDKVWWDGLLYKLHRIGIKGKLWRWLKNFICTRRFRVKQSNYLSDWFTTTAGLPQGTVLSVFLFLIFINDINDTPTLNLSSSLLNYSYKQWATPVQLPPPSSPLLTTHNNLFADDIALWPVMSITNMRIALIIQVYSRVSVVSNLWV